MKRKSTFYYEACPHEAIGALLCVQSDNLHSALTSEKRYQHGFLHYILQERTLRACMNLKLVRGVLRRRNYLFTGFVAGMPASIATRVPQLQPVLTEVQPHFHYPCFMQLCIDPRNQRKGLGTKLLEQLVFQVKKYQFDAIIADVPKGNEVAELFLLKQGFSVFPAPLLADRTIFCRKSDQ